MTEEISEIDRIQTGCKAIDTLMQGGLATGTITQIFGEKALGKSILSLQAACSAVAEGHSAIILDTEQSYFSYLIKYRREGLNKRFGKNIPIRELKLERVPRSSKKNKGPLSRSQLVTALSSMLNSQGVAYNENHLSAIADMLSPEYQVKLEGTDPSVMVIQMPEITDLLALHGIDADKAVSEGGRVELRMRSTPVYQSALYQIVQQTKAKLLVYDSISAPFKSAFPNTQDLPARSAGLAMLLAHSQRLCVQFGIAVVVTSHASIDPMHAWDRRPYGGVTLGHEAKFSFELTKATSKRNEDAVAVNPEEKQEDGGRAFWVQRHPAMADYSQFGYANIDDEGFH
jgi:RecA/RadA recombinase